MLGSEVSREATPRAMSRTGRLLYRLRKRWRDGTTEIVFEPHQLLQRLVPLIPAPRAHQVRYHGVFAPCAGWRDRVVPAEPRSSKASRYSRCHAGPGEETGPGADEGDGARPTDLKARQRSTAAEGGHLARRYTWADLLRRVFAVDVLECPDCGGRMRILAAIHPPDATRAILECLGLPSRAPPASRARPEPESPNPAPPDW